MGSPDRREAGNRCRYNGATTAALVELHLLRRSRKENVAPST